MDYPIYKITFTHKSNLIDPNGVKPIVAYRFSFVDFLEMVNNLAENRRVKIIGFEMVEEVEDN